MGVTSVSYLKRCDDHKIQLNKVPEVCVGCSPCAWAWSVAFPPKTEITNVDSDETICRDRGLDWDRGAVLCPVALAVGRLNAFRVLSGGRRFGLGVEGAAARHRRHHVCEFPFYPFGSDGTQPAGDTGHWLCGHAGPEHLAGAQPARSGEGFVQCFRDDGERQCTLVRELPLVRRQSWQQ